MISSSGVMIFWESDAEGGEEEEAAEEEEDEKRRVAMRGRARGIEGKGRVETIGVKERKGTRNVEIGDLVCLHVRRRVYSGRMCAAASGRREGIHTLMSTAGLSSLTYLESILVQSASPLPW